MNVNSPLTHQQLPKTKPGIEAHFFITSIYQSRVESMRIQRREKLKLLLKGFWGPSAPAKAQRLRLMLLTLSIYLDRVSVKEN